MAAFDTSVPNQARMYDYWLGGKDNFAADREAAEMSSRAVPQLPQLARENRAFLGRAVRYCGARAGITQFLDIGSGLPTMENVHQVAGPSAAVVYVDVDPVVVSHAQALLSTPRTTAMAGDLTRPGDILDAAQRLIDFSQPVAILLVAVLHFIPDEDDPAGCVAKLRDAMAPGSCLVISHIEVFAQPGAGSSQTADDLAAARRGTPTGPARSRADIAGFFGDLTLVDPGLTEVWDWRPEPAAVPVNAGDFMTLVGGVGRKD